MKLARIVYTQIKTQHGQKMADKTNREMDRDRDYASRRENRNRIQCIAYYVQVRKQCLRMSTVLGKSHIIMPELSSFNK